MPVNTSFHEVGEAQERQVVPLEPQGERRRRQLIEIASRLIAAEGVHAASLPRVAELAGVGRTAIYRYFARVEDLRLAVEADFYTHLLERITEAEFQEGLLALADANPDEPPPATLRLSDALWETLVDRGPAGLILRAQAPAHDVQDEVHEVGTRFAAPLVSLGLTPIEAELVGDSSNAILTRLYFRALHGEIEREEARELGSRALIGLVSAFRSS